MPGLHENILTPIKLEALRMSGRCLIWSPLTARGCRLSVAGVVEVRLHFSCPKMSDRLPYQSEVEQLVLERGLVVAKPVVPFSRFSRDLWNPGYTWMKISIIQAKK